MTKKWGSSNNLFKHITYNSYIKAKHLKINYIKRNIENIENDCTLRKYKHPVNNLRTFDKQMLFGDISNNFNAEQLLEKKNTFPI